MERRELTAHEPGVVCPECRDAACSENSPKTFYVHLLDGEIVSITEVTGLRVTSNAIVIERHGMPSLTYLRSHVYYACCDKDRPPSSQW